MRSEMTINTAGKFVIPLFLVLQESKKQFGSIVMQKLAKYLLQIWSSSALYQERATNN